MIQHFLKRDFSCICYNHAPPSLSWNHFGKICSLFFQPISGLPDFSVKREISTTQPKDLPLAGQHSWCRAALVAGVHEAFLKSFQIEAWLTMSFLFMGWAANLQTCSYHPLRGCKCLLPPTGRIMPWKDYLIVLFCTQCQFFNNLVEIVLFFEAFQNENQHVQVTRIETQRSVASETVRRAFGQDVIFVGKWHSQINQIWFLLKLQPREL